jgi:hypothetical protein
VIKLYLFLKTHPLIGFMSGWAAYFIPYVNELAPLAQFIGVVLGILVAGLTAIAKALEIRDRLRKIKKDKEQ